MENENNNEPVVTLKDVIDFVASAVVVVCFFVVAFATIWCNWYVVRVALTIIVADIVLFCIFTSIDNIIEKFRK